MTADRSRNHAPGGRFYGRRRGKALRPGRQRLIDERLPGFRVDPIALAQGQPLDQLFGEAKRAYWLEIGFGGGEHLAHMAATHSDVGIIGCEPFVNGVASLLSAIEDRGLTNVRIHDDDARRLLPALPDAAFERIFMLYPDPWPKSRHHRRRFVSPASVEAFARLLVDNGLFHFASDHMGYIRWTLEHFLASPDFDWLVEGPADWRERPADAIETRYEAKAKRQGARCAFLEFQRRPRG